MWIISNLTAEYGYHGTGESFSILDPQEVWHMEFIGRGAGEKGVVFVAMRVPEGMIGAHANQARIRTFPRNDPEMCLFSPDIVDFAVRKGLYPRTADPLEFSFADVFDPITAVGARTCDARVWALFNLVVDGGMGAYLDYAQGRNLSNRMPLFVKPAAPLTLNDTFWMMRTHFEGTWFDDRGLPSIRPDVGAGPFYSPYRNRPVEWSVGGKNYVNERTVGTTHAAFNLASQGRSWFSSPAIGSVLWFAVDDTAFSVHTPVYSGSARLPPAFADRYGQLPLGADPSAVDADIQQFSFDSAFWIFNLLANFVYARYETLAPLVQQRMAVMERTYMELVESTDATAEKLWASGDEAAARDLLTEVSVSTGTQLVADWKTFFGELFARYRDGYDNVPLPVNICRSGVVHNCTFRPAVASTPSGYPTPWYSRIVDESGSHYEIGPEASPRLEQLAKQKLKLI